jgi:hypothetical protein
VADQGSAGRIDSGDVAAWGFSGIVAAAIWTSWAKVRCGSPETAGTILVYAERFRQARDKLRRTTLVTIG